MNRYIIFLLISVNIVNIKGQSLQMSFGPMFTSTNAVVPIVNGKSDFENTGYFFEYKYTHYLKNKLSLSLSFAKYKGCSFILFERGGYISDCFGEVIAIGFCDGAKINRVTADVSYNLMNKRSKFYLAPDIGIGFQIAQTTGVEYWRDDGCPINGPNYFELEPMEAIPMNTTQIVPSLGFRTGFVFWKRLDIGLGVQGVYAFKPYQKMYLKYEYKGTPQPMVEYESTGTGLFVTLGVGYRFAKLIK